MAKNGAHIKLEYSMKNEGESVHITGGMTDEGFTELVAGMNAIPKEVIPQLVIKIMMKRLEQRIQALTPEKINDLMDYFHNNPDALFSTSVLPHVEDDSRDKSTLSVKIKRENNDTKIGFTTQLHLQELPSEPRDLADIMQAVVGFELVQYNEKLQTRTEDEWMKLFAKYGDEAETLYQEILKRRKVH